MLSKKWEERSYRPNRRKEVIFLFLIFGEQDDLIPINSYTLSGNMAEVTPLCMDKVKKKWLKLFNHYKHIINSFPLMSLEIQVRRQENLTLNCFSDF